MLTGLTIAEDAFIAEHHCSGWAKFGTTALRYRENFTQNLVLVLL